MIEQRNYANRVEGIISPSRGTHAVEKDEL